MVCGAVTALVILFSSKIVSKVLNTILFSLIFTDKMVTSPVEHNQTDGAITLSDVTELIDFSCEDGQRQDVHSREVVVESGGGTHTQGSSLIKLRNIVDYNWEHKLYTGQLLAVHVSGDFLAYAVKVAAPGTSSSAGLVRVVQRSTERRALLKGMQGLIQDLSFAFIANQVILACIDSTSSFYIYQLHPQTDAIVLKLLLSVTGCSESQTLTNRIVWCSYVPEEGEGEEELEEEDPSRLLVSTCGSRAYVWNIAQLINKHGNGPHQLHNVAEPCNTVDHHSQDILEATFSPDGSALATASKDGLVKFFQPSLLQVYNHNEKIKCIHQWSPHGDKPVSSLFFLDSRTTSSSDQFWKYVVTGYENVVKIWSCKDWSCLQTITFNGSSLLKLGLSRSAEQLLVSDITRRLLYVLDLTLSTSTSSCHCTSLTHFYLPFPFLSFADVHVGRKVYKCPSSCEDPYHSTTLADDENDSPVDVDHMLELDDMEGVVDGGGDSRRIKRDGCSVCSVLHMYLVQPKSLQHASITLPDHQIHPTALPQPPPSLSPLVQPLSTDICNHNVIPSKEVDTSGCSDTPEILPQVLSPQHSIALAHQSQQLKNMLMRSSNSLPAPGAQLLPTPPHPHALNLMTPDAFSSPPKRDAGEDKEETVGDAGTLHTDAPLTPNKVFGDVKYTASGGSSPSREVQEILSVKGTDYYEEDPDDEEGPVIPCPESSVLTNHKNTEENIPVDAGWPSIDMEKINEANQRKATSEANLNNSLNKSGKGNLIDISMNINGDNSATTTTLNTNQMLYDMSTAIHTLTLAMSEQQKELTLLRSELCIMRNAANKGSEIEEVKQIVEAALTRHGAAMKQVVDGALAGRAEAERLQRDSLLSGVSQIVGAHLGEKLANSVAHETRTTLLPAIHNILEPIIKALKTDLARSLSTTDCLLAENIEKLVNSKSVNEGLCVSVGQAVGESSRQAFKEAIQTNLAPLMEKALAQMLKQINTTFTSGVKEYLISLESCTKRAVEQSGKVDETCCQLNSMSTQLQQVLEQQNKHYINSTQSDHLLKVHLAKEIQSSLSKSLQGALDVQLSKMKEVVKEQINVGISTHVAHLEDSVLHAVRSGAQTPAPAVIDTQQHIDQLLQKGDVNVAFQMALSAADLRLVVHCCQRVDPRQLFSQKPCPLQQNVLLSLIQQLGADMTSDTKLKHMFLQDAVVNLDKNNPVTKEHMPVVLMQLKKYISTFITANPTHESTSNMRLLIFAIEHLLAPDS